MNPMFFTLLLVGVDAREDSDSSLPHLVEFILISTNVKDLVNGSETVLLSLQMC